jgi:hypothetical protein
VVPSRGPLKSFHSDATLYMLYRESRMKHTEWC